jgi:hypothetical protein
MKLCPQCEFIYEDDQNLCDMDGEALVYDPRLGVIAGAGPPVTSPRPTRSRLRILVVPLVAGLVLSSLLFIAYCASSRLLNLNFASPSRKSIAPQTNLQRQIAPQPNNPSSHQTPSPSPTPTNPETDSKPTSRGTDEPKDKLVSTRGQAVPKIATLKTTDYRLTIPRELPPLPRLTPLPRLLSAQRLTVKAGPKAAGSTTSQKQRLTNQQSAASSQKSVIVEVSPPGGSTKKRTGVGGFLKKTAHALTKPLKF